MRTVYERKLAQSREIERAIVQGDAQMCVCKFGIVCKALWPIKTAAELAARVGCAIRTADYEISGERHPSAQSLMAVMKEITPPYK